jgi:Tfp pilus assembly protein FimV
MAAIAFAPASVPRRHTPRRHSPRPAAYRRRVLAFALLALIPFVLSWAARTTLGGGSLTAPGRSAPSRTYVVQSGDTLWNVARALHPGGDLRATVDRLASAHRGSGLQAGERIALR